MYERVVSEGGLEHATARNFPGSVTHPWPVNSMILARRSAGSVVRWRYQVVPPRRPDGPPCGGSTWTSPALRRSYRATEDRGRNKIRITKVSTVSGEPRPA
jgi:hypothetical protein